MNYCHPFHTVTSLPQKELIGKECRRISADSETPLLKTSQAINGRLCLSLVSNLGEHY